MIRAHSTSHDFTWDVLCFFHENQEIPNGNRIFSNLFFSLLQRSPLMLVHRNVWCNCCGFDGFSVYYIPSLNLTVRTWKCTSGKGDSYWKASFLGAMLVSGRVRHYEGSWYTAHPIFSSYQLTLVLCCFFFPGLYYPVMWGLPSTVIRIPSKQLVNPILPKTSGWNFQNDGPWQMVTP